MNFEIYNEDCIAGMKHLADNSVDMILTDLPYNLTACKWDLTPIDLPAMWEQFKRILKPQCSAVMFASGKFTFKLVASNFEQFKYKWIWVKNAPTMFVHAKNAPMRKYEEICVFSDGSINHASCTTRRMKYNPQGVVPCGTAVKYSPHTSQVSLQGGKLRTADDFLANGELKTSQLRSPIKQRNTNRADSIIGDRPSRACGTTYEQTHTGYPSDVLEFDELPGKIRRNSTQTEVCAGGGKLKSNWERHGRLKAFGAVVGKRPSHVDYYIQEQTGYPSDVLNFKVPHDVKKLHPSQKPIALLEYLIRTYSDEGETVLDATMGSGSTGVACMNTGRNFIGFELEQKFFDIAQKRITDARNENLQRLF